MTRLRALLPLLLLLGCVPTVPVSVASAPLSAADKTVAQAYIRESLRDPDGARFRREEGFRTSQGDTIICGEYNATNGFGGYVGYSTYYIRLRDGLVDAAQFGNSFGAIGCRDARAGTIEVPA
ncbi:hypothetical protein [Jannaschia sp. M317]|uniref:hypothetical protein n=1 Tax=Jannaschia sp. M317 TaxID=2867011 RepID=UPI0021A90577|nr:hypothetical protein [Jannaschia sp. M317]UWQ16127.1 hypothetical protein K3551_09250 [Jannaschia sp. M317]